MGGVAVGAGEFPNFKPVTEQAISSTYLSNRGPFVKWARKKFGLREVDALDVYQEAIMAFVRHQGHQGNALHCEPSTFLFAIGRNLALKHIRNRGRQSDVDLGDADLAGQLNDPEVLLDAERDHACQVIQDGLAALSDRQREVLRLYYFEEKSMAEIAVIMGYNNADVAKKMKYEGFRKLSSLVAKGITLGLLLHVG